MSSFKKGFTLVELSISMVIIGLLVAGVAAGTSLIKQAQLTKQISQFSQSIADYRAFKTAYNYAPGDFPNAFALWGNATTCLNGSVHTAVANCNGDGGGDLNGATGAEGQNLLYRHLQFAGILKANFSVYTLGTTGVIPTHFPAGAIVNSGFYAAYDNYYGVVPIQDMFIMGAAVTGNSPYGAVLIPWQAKAMDLKFDDGNPVTGKFLSGTSPSGATGLCPNGIGSENLTNATDYTLSNNSVACRSVILYN